MVNRKNHFEWETKLDNKPRNRNRQEMKRTVRNQEIVVKETKIMPKILNYKVHMRGLTQVII